MRDEDRFDRYLSARAAVLELPAAGIASVALVAWLIRMVLRG